MKNNLTLLEAIQGTAEIYGRQLTAIGAEMLLQDLRKYPEAAVVKALAKCRSELRTFPSLSEIIDRLEDGHPGVEEAWAMIPKDELGSVIWTDEMAQAFGAARELLESDEVGARMTFREVYKRLLAESRSHQGRRPRWTPSLGHDKAMHQAAFAAAVEKGRMTHAEARQIAPHVYLPPPGACKGGVESVGGVARRLIAERNLIDGDE